MCKRCKAHSKYGVVYSNDYKRVSVLKVNETFFTFDFVEIPHTYTVEY